MCTTESAQCTLHLYMYIYIYTTISVQCTTISVQLYLYNYICNEMFAGPEEQRITLITGQAGHLTSPRPHLVNSIYIHYLLWGFYFLSRLSSCTPAVDVGNGGQLAIS